MNNKFDITNGFKVTRVSSNSFVVAVLCVVLGLFILFFCMFNKLPFLGYIALITSIVIEVV